MSLHICLYESETEIIMDWIKTIITTTRKGIDSVSGCLLQLGINGIEICDKDDFKEFLEDNHKYWDYVDEELEKLKEADTTITFYLTCGSDGIELLNAVRSSMVALKALDVNNEYGSLDIKTENVKDEDWSEIWKQYFHPTPVGEKILICPEWEMSDVTTDRTVFTVNPGMSFGTGSHPSTRFCLEEIERYVKDGDTILDLGCGSGILSITGILLGASSAIAVDIDSNATDAARSNLQLNKLSDDVYETYTGDIISDSQLRDKLGKHNIVLANIVADVIIAIAPFIRGFMNENAIFICSGIILERLEEVKQALNENGLKIINIKQDDDWAAITAV